MQAYAAAKASVLRMSKVALVNRDDPLVLEMIPALDAMNVRSFGRALPELEGDMGLEDSNGMAWLATADAPDFDPPRARSRRDKTMSEPRRRAGVVKRLMPVDALRVRGMHNAMNALAALALAHTVHPAWAAMLHALRDYVGERHRTEFVRSIAGVDFVNDSKGTNVGATVAALEGMGQTTVLIAGGLGKGQDFAPLAEAVKQHARAVVLIGQDRRLIGGALADVGLPVELADSLESAVARSLELARQGDVVLLSPACASMDMFLNYGQRGDQFIEAVHELALEKGEAA
jgi:UDP-N-acetylmuramoylalanine--D-glutamate ligase